MKRSDVIVHRPWWGGNVLDRKAEVGQNPPCIEMGARALPREAMNKQGREGDWKPLKVQKPGAALTLRSPATKSNQQNIILTG